MYSKTLKKIYKSFDGLCCPPSIWNKFFQIQIIFFFFLIEYKFSFNHGQGHVLEKQKMQQQQEQWLQAHCSDWFLCSWLFILWDWYSWIFKSQSGRARKVNGSGYECLYMGQTALLLVFQWVGSRPAILI